MADGRDDRRGDNGDGDQGSSYDWLYSGGSGGSGGPAPDPDATQVIDTRGHRGGAGDAGRSGADDRTQVVPTAGASSRPRSGDRGDAPPTSIAPTPGTAPPSARRRSQESSPKRARTRRKRPGRWIALALAAWLVFLVVVPVFAWMSVAEVDAEPAGARPDDQPGTTYLVVGSDARKGLAGQRTDTIMLLHTGSGPNLLMSIPRDSIVEIPGRGTNKINAAFAFGGPKLLTRTIEQSTDIRIDDYVEIGFTGFVEPGRRRGRHRDLPEAGAEGPATPSSTSPRAARRPTARPRSATPAPAARQTLGDIDRAQHQREVVSAIGSEVLSWKTVVNPVRYWRVVFGGAELGRGQRGHRTVRRRSVRAAR